MWGLYWTCSMRCNVREFNTVGDRCDVCVRCDGDQCGGGEENVCMFYLSVSLLFVQFRCVTRHVALSVSGRKYV